MANFIAMMQLIAALYPILMQTVKALEEAMPEPGHGPQKLELLKATLAAAYTKMDNTKMKFDEVWPTLSTVVGAIVTVLNTSGIFKKKK